MGVGCIVEGYKIQTEQGLMAIDEIVKKNTNKGCEFNHKENKVEYKKIISYQENPIMSRSIVEIDLEMKVSMYERSSGVY